MFALTFRRPYLCGFKMRLLTLIFKPNGRPELEEKKIELRASTVALCINYTLKKSFTFFLDFDSIWQTSKNNEFWRMLFVQAWNPKDYFRTVFLSEIVSDKTEYFRGFSVTKNRIFQSWLRIWFSCNWLHSLLVRDIPDSGRLKSIDLATDHPKNLRKRSEAKILPTNLTTK